MKKILLATTMLVGTAGWASAEVAFSGSAAAGVARDGDTPFETYSSVGLDVTFSGATDNGLEFGATFGVSAGRSYDFGEDPLARFADEDGTFGMPEIYISGSFGKIAFSDDNFDFYDDANGSGDVQYTGTFGAITVGVTADVDASEFSGSADATFSGITVHADADTYAEYNASAAYTLGAFTAKVGAGMSDVDGTTYFVTGTYVAGAITAEATYNDDSSYDLSLDYSANSISAGVTYDDAGDYTVTAGYDLGGGLTLEAGYDNDASAFIGAAMSF